MKTANDKANVVSANTMNIRLPARSFYAGLVVVLSLWILHSFLHALLAACVTAIASWPLYARFSDRLPGRIGKSVRYAQVCLIVVQCGNDIGLLLGNESSDRACRVRSSQEFPD